jgi:hypothetical protein
LASNTTYHIRAYATNSAGTIYGADLTFTTANAYYEGFETGFPPTWSGIGWGVTTTGIPYELYNCLRANQVNDSIQFTRTVTSSPNGNISFYIDNVLKSTFGESSWTLHSYSIPTGTHIFKWKVACNPNANGAFIDYIIVSQ